MQSVLPITLDELDRYLVGRTISGVAIDGEAIYRPVRPRSHVCG
jgi:hypothetical protein